MLAALALAACGADADLPPSGIPGESEPGTLTGGAGTGPTEEEIASVRANLGEPTCATGPFEATYGELNTMVRSPNASYGHPTCLNGYVVERKNTYYDTWLSAQANPAPTSNLLECLFSWSYVAGYQKVGADYVKFGEQLKLGALVLVTGGPRVPIPHFVCNATAQIQVPEVGDYKVVAAAGNFFTGYLPVDVF